MAKIIALDVGTKRTGIAETDPLQIIASGLTTVNTSQIISFLKEYVVLENPEALIIGQPKRLHGEFDKIEKFILELIQKINGVFPTLKIERIDERFTSKMAFGSMIDSGLKKKQRQDKAMIDQVSATIILQTWLNNPR